MEKRNSYFRYFLNTITQPVRTAVLCFVLIMLIVIAVVYTGKDNHAGITKNENIDVTPEMIKSIESIGQWEFLSVSDEELVDTVRKGFFRDSELVRIYYGTLRLGIDLRGTRKNWIKANNDSVFVTLPAIKLLDNDFIDEARTKSFFESGNWTEHDRNQLYERAHNNMIKRCLTKQNISSAQQNATHEFSKLMRSMGFRNVSIKIENSQIKK